MLLSVRPSRTLRIIREPKDLACPNLEGRFPTLDATRTQVSRSNGQRSRLETGAYRVGRTRQSQCLSTNVKIVISRTYVFCHNGQLNGIADSHLVLRPHGQRVVRVWLQVLNANATVCQKRQKLNIMKSLINYLTSKHQQQHVLVFCILWCYQ